MNWSIGNSGDENQIFVDGQMMNQACWPTMSLDPSHPTWIPTDSVTFARGQSSGTATFYAAALDNYAANYFLGATIRYLPGPEYYSYTGTVTASGPAVGATEGYVTFTADRLGTGVIRPPRIPSPGIRFTSLAERRRVRRRRF